MNNLSSIHEQRPATTVRAPKVVVVHRGGRDSYQVASAFAEAGLLEQLVTDLYWPNDRAWANKIAAALPSRLKSPLLARYRPAVPSSHVTQVRFSGLISHLLDSIASTPFSWKRWATRWADASLGTRAGKLAVETDALLVSYSYYCYHAVTAYQRPGVLFQAHPHPISVRNILHQELLRHPECESSLRTEWELCLPDEDFARLVAEPTMASHILVASSFTRQTLIENGAPAGAISVVPYGVDLERFSPSSRPRIRTSNEPLRLLFVGRINQRKGIKYLLEALRLLDHENIELTICGRVVDGLELFKSVGSNVHIRPSVNSAQLLEAYRSADLFVLPSVVEGFGQVLLEALACGLPILSTTHTAAPDLIEEGVQGFVVYPGRADLLAQRIEWAFRHPRQVADMRIAARLRAEQFTWERFRKHVVESVYQSLRDQKQICQEVVARHA